MIAAAVIPAAISAYSSWRAGQEGKATDEAKRNALKQIIQQYKDLPVEEYQKLIEWADIPKVEAAIDKISPLAKDAQADALARLGQQSETGYTAEDRLREEEARQSANRANQAQQSAILANMAQRGIGGGGQEIALKGQAQQNAANTAYMAQLNQAASAQQRALDALKSYEGAARGMRGQDASEASARDAINQFNANNKIKYLDYMQGIANKNVDLKNEKNRDILGAQTGYNNNAPISSNQDMYAGMGAGASQVASGIGGIYNQEREDARKEQIRQDEMDFKREELDLKRKQLENQNRK